MQKRFIKAFSPSHECMEKPIKLSFLFKIMENKNPVGEVTHYYDKIGVAIVKLSNRLKVGDIISIEGKSTNFQQKVESIQIEHINVEEAGSGESIGLKVIQKVREGDKIYKVL
jgi:putative protease